MEKFRILELGRDRANYYRPVHAVFRRGGFFNDGNAERCGRCSQPAHYQLVINNHERSQPLAVSYWCGCCVREEIREKFGGG